ncbi:MAG: hypothetical protein AAGD01_04025 [Acidobacteriota bacterium]
MAVHDRAYRRYDGPLTGSLDRFLVIPRYALKGVFASRLYLAFFVLSFVPVVFGAVAIYVLSNEALMQLLSIEGPAAGQVSIDTNFFYYLLVAQGFLSFLSAVVVAPALLAPDLMNNALPLYLSRPLSRWCYLGGKASVLMGLLSTLTWIPLFGLFAMQSYAVEGWAWDRLWVLAAIFLSSMLWISVLTLMGLAFSAWVRWKPLARLAMVGVFFLSGALGQMINAIFFGRMSEPWGDMLNLFVSMRLVWRSLFQQTIRASELPVPYAWIALLALCALCVFLLSRKVRAYEVVR